MAAPGDLERAAAAAQRRALAIRPDYALAHNDLGICHERRGETALALAAYRRAVALDMPELIVPDLDAYVDAAIRLGGDAGARSRIKARLADRRRTRPLFDTRRWVRALERAFSRMWANYAAGGESPRVMWVDGESRPAPRAGG